MALTYGFYNSRNHDRMYDAVQLSQIFDGLIHDGVYATVGDHFSVQAGSMGGTITIGSGRAWFLHTWSYNDTLVLMTLPAPSIGKYRYDAVVLDVNANADVRENQFMIIEGYETSVYNEDWSEVEKPTLINEDMHRQYPLAYIKRRPDTLDVIDGDIINVVGSDEEGCPWVKGVIEYIDTSDLLRQAASDWSNFVQDTEVTASQWFEDFSSRTEFRVGDWEIRVTNNFLNWQTGVENDFTTWSTARKNEFLTWMTGEKADFDTWFENIQYILDGDVAGHLQNEIEDLANRVTPIKNGGTGNNHGHIQSGFKDLDYNKGEFSTSEGMNTVSVGKCAHAEGGGDYTYGYQDAHLEGDRYYRTDETNPSYVPGHHYVRPVSVTLTGSSSEDVTADLIGNFDFFTPYDESEFNDDQIVSAYLACVLKNETKNEVLKADVFAIGSGSVDNESYSSVGLDNSFSESNTDLDFCIFPIQYTNNQIGKANYSQYWYINSDAPENSTILISGVPMILIREQSGSSYDRFEASAGISPKYRSMSSGSQFIVKAGNTDTYSLQLYYSYALESEAIAAGYDKYQSIPSKDEEYAFICDGTSISLVNETIDSLSGDSHLYRSFAILKNGVVKYSRNISPYTSSSGLYVKYSDPSDNVDINLNLKSVSIGQGKSYSGANKTFYNSNGKMSGTYSIGTSGYTIAFSYDYITGPNPYKLINDAPTGFEYPIKYFPAGEVLRLQKYPTRAIGDYAHAEGKSTKAYGLGSHAEGLGGGDYVDDSLNPGAYGTASHVEGNATWANGYASHAEGNETYANGDYSHSGGIFTEANGNYSFVHGYHVKANDIAQIAFGYDAHNSGSGDSNQIKHVTTSIFGFGSYPRYRDSSKDESSGLSTIEEANEIVNKNRSGFTIVLRCGLTKNSIYYKALMPNDTFGTFVELMELIEGDPSDKYVAYSGRILKLYPIGLDGSNCGIVEAVELFDSNSLTNIMIPSAGTNVSIGGVNYKYPIINITNSIDAAVSTANVQRFIKYSLIRLI